MVVDLVFNSLEQHSASGVGAGAGGARSGSGSASNSSGPARLDPRELQINLTGFLEKAARPFVAELWALLLSAQASPSGIPQQLIDAKKAELLQAQQAALAEAERQKAIIAQAAAAARAAAGLSATPALAPVAAAPGAAAPAPGERKRVSRFGPAPSVRLNIRTRPARVHDFAFFLLFLSCFWSYPRRPDLPAPTRQAAR